MLIAGEIIEVSNVNFFETPCNFRVQVRPKLNNISVSFTHPVHVFRYLIEFTELCPYLLKIIGFDHYPVNGAVTWYGW